MLVADSPAAYGFDPGRYPSWRTGQRQVIQQIVDWYLDPDSPKVLLLEAPTGVGKSLIAGAAIVHLRDQEQRLNHGVITTTTLNLQRQYMRDTLQDHARSAWGRSNFDCLVLPVNVAEAPCQHGYKCNVRDDCDYYHERDQAHLASIAVVNTAFYLVTSNYAETSRVLIEEDTGTVGGEARGHLFDQAELAIHDEAHLLEKAVQSLVEVDFSRSFFTSLGIEFPQTSNYGDWHAWLDEHTPTVEALAHAYRSEARKLAQMGQMPQDPQGRRAVTQHGNMVRAFNEVLPSRPLIEPTDFGVKFRAVWGKDFAPQYLWDHAHKHLLMSATIIHPEFIAESLGLQRHEWAYLEMPSPFHPMRRRIVYNPVLKVSYRTTPEEFAVLIRTMDDIIADTHMRQNGIIHSVSYARAKQILATSRHRGRMIAHAQGKGEKERAIGQFIAAPPGSILVSPAVGIGEDFGRGDNCRFQIFPKYPIPYMGDPVVKARAEEDRESMWFEADMAFVQAVGRGMRSEDDACVSYVLDSSAARQLYKLPQSIKDAIIDRRPARQAG